MSRPVTLPPATAAGIAALPVPQATSSTMSPSLTPTRSTRSSPTCPDPVGDRVEVAGRPDRPRALALLGVAHHRAILCGSGGLRQVLLELEHRREEVAVAFDAFEHVRGLEAHRVGIARCFRAPPPRPSSAASTPRAARDSAASRRRRSSSSSRSDSSRPAPCPCAAPSFAARRRGRARSVRAPAPPPSSTAWSARR